MKTMTMSAAMAASAFSLPAAAQTVYFGERPSSGTTVSGAPVTARNAFLGQLSGASTDDFEGLPGGTPPATLTFAGSAGPITASFTGATGQICTTNGCGGGGVSPRRAKTTSTSRPIPFRSGSARRSRPSASMAPTSGT